MIYVLEADVTSVVCDNISLPTVCPRCNNSNVLWDKIENEPYCFVCGWRRAVKITTEEAKNWDKKDTRHLIPWTISIFETTKILDLTNYTKSENIPDACHLLPTAATTAYIAR